MVDSPEILRKLAEYLNGEASQEAFEGWLVSSTWDMNNPNLDGFKLAGEIELCFAEASNGDWTKAELEGLLREIAERYVASS